MSEDSEPTGSQAVEKTGFFRVPAVIAAAMLVALLANGHTRRLLPLLGISCALMLVQVLGSVIATLLARVPINEVGIGFGPAIFSLRRGRTLFTLGMLPVGGFVGLPGMDYDHRYKGDDGFQSQGLPARLGMTFSGCLALFVFAALCLGPAEAAQKLSTGFVQFFAGALAPRSEGRGLIEKALALAESGAWTVLMGTLAAKAVAYNLLPIPGLNGGQALMEVLRPRLEKAPGMVQWMLIVGLLVTWSLAAGWFIAFCSVRTGG